MLTPCQQDRERKTGWAGPGWSEGGRVGKRVLPDATFPRRPPTSSLSRSPTFPTRNLGGGGAGPGLRGARNGPSGEGNCPCPRGQMEVSIQGGGKQPPPEPPPPHFLVPRWAGGAGGAPLPRPGTLLRDAGASGWGCRRGGTGWEDGGGGSEGGGGSGQLGAGWGQGGAGAGRSRPRHKS